MGKVGYICVSAPNDPLAMPEFTFLNNSGQQGRMSKIVEPGKGWRIKFLESGTVTFDHNAIIDVFVVGGGGGGSIGWGTGGGGGRTKTSKGISISANTKYSITIGQGGTGHENRGDYGKSTTAFNIAASGGNGGVSDSNGGDGGSGGGRTYGNGGSDGGDGIGGQSTQRAGHGQGYTTREFGELSGTLYSGGGGGADSSRGGGKGGAGGGGDADRNGTDNTGGGGGGDGGKGGSGIAVIRNARG